ncbi:hypothetical protein F5B22DRAFT_557660 [Xylaria bambusicola]|uniref:uncharacterized protein n=1 Tax=Xylaria bambusicola TaxID=326684 RepID=UPI002008D40C|nr:uncharacterized protein F5B22DRAFT_557660 [Xylaria bambusicola]KAI0503303.1 hypothetical protein F5B22DRAFT_557660 [Xylaria bambusicola]
MLAAHNQENITFNRQHAAAVKQQQGQATRPLGAKTPGAKFSKTPMKVPLNDENGANAMTSKALKGGDKSAFATPMTQRARAVLGDKTTNAKAKGMQTVNVKSAVNEIEKSQVRLQNTVRQRQREPQAETRKLQVHAEEPDIFSDDEVEYCPPRPKDLPYESDVFPDGVLTFDALKPENMMKGYYRYYFNPVDENGISKRDRELAQETKKAIREGEMKIKADLETFDWSIKAELDADTDPVKKPVAKKLPAPRKPLSTIRSRNAANALSLDDTTMSMQRKAVKRPEPMKPMHKKSSSFVIPALRTNRPGSSQLPTVPKKSPTEFDATSRTTIGYNKGRATASLLTKTTTSAQPKRNTAAPLSTTIRGIPRSNTTLSNDSDKTITPARYAQRQATAASAAAEDYALRERVPFLSIFNPNISEDEDEESDPLGINSRPSAFLDEDEDEEFELKLDD